VTEDRTIGRPLALLGGVAALIAAVLGIIQIDAGRKSNRAGSEGSRLAVEIFRELTSAGLDLNLEASVLLNHIDLETTADSISVLTGEDSQSGLRATALADRRTADRLKRAGEKMIGKPLGDPQKSSVALLADQAALAARLEAMVARQNDAIEEADRFSRRSSGASRGLLLVATAGALLALAGSIGERRPALVAMGGGVLLLLAAVATGVLALLA
jgi:hypothetical protein